MSELDRDLAAEAEIVFSDRAEHHRYGSPSWGVTQDPPTVAGHCEVYRVDGLWFAYNEGSGGSYRSIGYATRDEAIREIRRSVALTQTFWDEKVRWRRAGDRTPHGQRVVRIDGQHKVIEREPTRQELMGSRLGIGYSGHQFVFRFLATGEEIESRNVWSQGIIPAEYRALLPDNAVYVQRTEVAS